MDSAWERGLGPCGWSGQGQGEQEVLLHIYYCIPSVRYCYCSFRSIGTYDMYGWYIPASHFYFPFGLDSLFLLMCSVGEALKLNIVGMDGKRNNITAVL